MKFKIFILAALLLASGPVKSQGIITLAEDVLVSGVQYSFRNLINHEVPTEIEEKLQKIFLAKTPSRGQTHFYSRQYLQYLLQQNNLAAENFEIPARVKVNGDLISVSKVDLKAALIASLQESNPALLVSLPRCPADFSIPAGKVDYIVERTAPWQIPGNNSITVSVMAEGILWKKMVLQVYLDEMGTALRLTREVRLGESLSGDDLVAEECLKSELPAHYIPYDQFSAGMRVRRTLAAGTILVSHHLESIPAMERGNTVTIKVIANGIEITAPGEALEQGDLGATIRVKNLNNGQILRCLIERDDLVLLVID